MHRTTYSSVYLFGMPVALFIRHAKTRSVFTNQQKGATSRPPITEVIRAYTSAPRVVLAQSLAILPPHIERAVQLEAAVAVTSFRAPTEAPSDPCGGIYDVVVVKYRDHK